MDESMKFIFEDEKSLNNGLEAIILQRLPGMLKILRKKYIKTIVEEPLAILKNKICPILYKELYDNGIVYFYQVFTEIATIGSISNLDLLNTLKRKIVETTISNTRYVELMVSDYLIIKVIVNYIAAGVIIESLHYLEDRKFKHLSSSAPTAHRLLQTARKTLEICIRKNYKLMGDVTLKSVKTDEVEKLSVLISWRQNKFKEDPGYSTNDSLHECECLAEAEQNGLIQNTCIRYFLETAYDDDLYSQSIIELRDLELIPYFYPKEIKNKISVVPTNEIDSEKEEGARVGPIESQKQFKEPPAEDDSESQQQLEEPLIEVESHCRRLNLEYNHTQIHFKSEIADYNNDSVYATQNKNTENDILLEHNYINNTVYDLNAENNLEPERKTSNPNDEYTEDKDNSEDEVHTEDKDNSEDNENSEDTETEGNLLPDYNEYESADRYSVETDDIISDGNNDQDTFDSFSDIPSDNEPYDDDDHYEGSDEGSEH